MVEEESVIYINTYTSLNNKVVNIKSCCIFAFGARRLFLGYEIFENYDCARDPSFLRCWRRKGRKCVLAFLLSFMSLLL